MLEGILEILVGLVSLFACLKPTTQNHFLEIVYYITIVQFIYTEDSVKIWTHLM